MRNDPSLPSATPARFVTICVAAISGDASCAYLAHLPTAGEPARPVVSIRHEPCSMDLGWNRRLSLDGAPEAATG